MPLPLLRRYPPATILIAALAVYAFTGLVFVGIVALNQRSPVFRAVIGMGWMLNLVWTIAGGLTMVLQRDRVRKIVQSIPLPWPVKFVLFCTLLALLEEAVTVSLTNAAPLFGVKVGEAYITASANYLDVVTFHSVIVFIPMFVCWAWLLSRYDFSPVAVFLLFGITGNLSEVQFGGVNNLFAGWWIFLYGLMVYLPSYSVPRDRNVRPPRWYHGLMAVFLPPVCSGPVVAVVVKVHPTQPVHFPPMRIG
jgi:hypothetical protein